jgi:hypothetical protein
MTTKQKILAALNDLPEDASFRDALDRLWLLRGVEISLRQADADDVISHEEFVKELLEEERLYDAEHRMDAQKS